MPVECRFATLFSLVLLLANCLSCNAFEFGTNTFSYSHGDNLAFVSQENALLNQSFEWVREWTYWSQIESQSGTFTWEFYDVAFYQFSQSKLKTLSVITTSPVWASSFLSVFPSANMPAGASSIPPCKPIRNELIQFASSGNVQPLASPDPLDNYLLAHTSTSLRIYNQWTAPNAPASGDYLVDFVAARITFSSAMLGSTVYLHYVDGKQSRWANVQLTVTSDILDGVGWRTLQSNGSVQASGALISDGALFVTDSPALQEGIDFTVQYTHAGRIERVPGGSIASGSSIYVSYYVLDVAPGSRWYSFISAFVSRYAAYLNAIAVWNEASGDGLYFFGSRSNLDLYASLLHQTAAAIRAAPLPNGSVTPLIVNGADEVSARVLEPQKQYGWLADQDVLSLHAYPLTPEWERLSDPPHLQGEVLVRVQTAAAVAASYYPSQSTRPPIWLTEIGWFSGTNNGGVSQQTKAAYLVRTFAQLAASPASVGMQFAWLGIVGPTNWGLVVADNNVPVPEPSYSAMKAFHSYVSPSRMGTALQFPRYGFSTIPLPVTWTLDSQSSAVVSTAAAVPTGTNVSYSLYNETSFAYYALNADISVQSGGGAILPVVLELNFSSSAISYVVITLVLQDSTGATYRSWPYYLDQAGSMLPTQIVLRSTCSWVTVSSCVEGVPAGALTKVVGILLSGNSLLGTLQGWWALHSLAIRRGAALGFSFGDTSVLWAVGDSIQQTVQVQQGSTIVALRDIDGNLLAMPTITAGTVLLNLSAAPVYLITSGQNNTTSVSPTSTNTAPTSTATSKPTTIASSSVRLLFSFQLLASAMCLLLFLTHRLF